MDITKEYLSMCEKAIEIQVLKNLDQDGDIFYSENLEDSKIFFNCHDEFEQYEKLSLASSEHSDETTTKLIWLPRQDQLIEMIEYPHGISRLIIELSIAIREVNELAYFGDTLEKIYLMYLMKKDYSKTWDGLNWVEAK
jgi:hypothetical protein